jgi:pyridoxal phosphate enzyme (YggS family)
VKAKNKETHIEDNIREVLCRIEAAAMRAGRSADDVLLLAATKNRTAAEVQEAVRAGIKVVGENRAQELLAKMGEVSGPVKWDFIGHLQRNKVRQVVGAVRLIHSLDSIRLAREIDIRAGEAGLVQQVLLQVNMAGETSKEGIEPEEVPELLKQLEVFRNIGARGLSTVAPFTEVPEEVRWVFRSLAELGRGLERENEGFKCEVLSMGMTNDYEIAVEEGSSCVRVGTAIFGRRDYPESG